MKIVFAIKNIHNSAGTEKATITVANGLAERGHDVFIVCLEKIGEPFFWISPKVRIEYLYPSKDKRPFFKKIPNRIKGLRNIFISIQPDLIIQVGSGRSILFMPASKGFKFATWEHFNIRINWNILHPLSKMLASKYGDAILTLTESDADSYRKKYKAKAFAVPNAYQLNQIAPILSKDKTVIAVGRLTHQKGFDLLLQAWAKTECKALGWKLRIVGDGRDREKLIKLGNKLGVTDTIVFTPNNPQVTSLMAEASVFVLSSRYEGLPLVLLEALAVGTPAVSFNCYSGPNEIIEDGYNGLLVNDGDISGLQLALDRITSDDKLLAQLTQNAKVSVEKFSVEKVLDIWEQRLQQI